MDHKQKQRRWMINNPFPRQPKCNGPTTGSLLFDRDLLPPKAMCTGDCFTVEWNPDRGGFLSVYHRDEPTRALWSTVPGTAFVTAAVGSSHVFESRGSFAIDDRIETVCNHQTVNEILLVKDPADLLPVKKIADSSTVDGDGTKLCFIGPAVVITGWLFSGVWIGSFSWMNRECIAVRYRLIFTERRHHHLGFKVEIDPPVYLPRSRINQRITDEFWLDKNMQKSIPLFNRVQLTYLSNKHERFYGFGEQFSCFDLKGKRVPILVQEQGLGRGDQPITALANLVSYRSGGSWHTTYAPSPYYMTSDMNSLFLETYDYSIFDLTRDDRVQIQAYAGSIEGRILHGRTPTELLKRYTEAIGRMRELPDWIISGAVVGMQGGTNAVKQVLNQLQAYNVPIAAFWLQDWVGQRKTSIGWQLWWNWEPDIDHYKGWQGLVKELKSMGIRTMAYCNPFLASVEEKKNKKRDLLKEAKLENYLVQNLDQEPYMIENTDFSAGLVDLTNPDARSWLKDILKDMIRTGVQGWMADFGEALPFDSLLFSGESPALLHNRYPELWAELNREVVEEWEAENNGDDDEQLVFFMRAGYTRSPRWSTLFWEGDQMVSWQRNDGIKSAVVGLLSSGISGYSFNHSDIGGYTTVNLPFVKYVRSEELLIRWMELNAFSAIFRTHEGNVPGANSQFYTNSTTLSYFSRCAKMYKAWEFYRKELVKEAATSGIPIVRHMFLHYPNDDTVRSINYEQFLVGTEILVVPVLDKGKNEVLAYFPAGNSWEHVWTKEVYGSTQEAVRAWIDAPLGYPAVFVKLGSHIRPILTMNLELI